MIATAQKPTLTDIKHNSATNGFTWYGWIYTLTPHTRENAISFWMARKPDLVDDPDRVPNVLTMLDFWRGQSVQNLTMLDFWRGQSVQNPLRRVALRTGGLQLSQCATERMNKLPKEIWSADRRSVSTASMAPDVFLHVNMEYYPPPKYRWPAN